MHRVALGAWLGRVGGGRRLHLPRRLLRLLLHEHLLNLLLLLLLQLHELLLPLLLQPHQLLGLIALRLRLLQLHLLLELHLLGGVGHRLRLPHRDQIFVVTGLVSRVSRFGIVALVRKKGATLQ